MKIDLFLWLKKVIYGFFLATLLIVFLVLYIRLIEKWNTFFPSKRLELTPEIVDLPFEDVYLTTQDGICLNGWFIPNRDTDYTLFFLHGNAGNIGDRVEKLKLLYELGVNLFIIDYRGYGKSEGKPSEKGLYLDAKTGYSYLVEEKKIDSKNIILYGESLGCAVAIDLAVKEEIGGVILEGAFPSIKEMGRVVYPFLPSIFFSKRFDSLSKISKIKAPVLFIHSKEDEIVPIRLAKKLYDNTISKKKFVELKGGHNTCFFDSRGLYLTSMRYFLGEELQS